MSDSLARVGCCLEIYIQEELLRAAMKTQDQKKSKIASALSQCIGQGVSNNFGSRVSLHMIFGVALMSLTGVVQAQSSDTDGDGVPDNVEVAEQTDPNNATNFLDSDGDTVPDILDNDSDGDNVLDINEFGGNPYRDTDNDGIPAYLDDNDQDAAIGNVDGQISFLFDPDNNNTAAFQDSTHDHRTDSDGDQVPDSIELAERTNPSDATSFIDTDNDGTPDIIDADSDADGIFDQLEAGALPYFDRDCDGVPAYLDNNDFLPSVGNDDNAVQATFDPDNDGVASFQDAAVDMTDSDGDGVPDDVEAIDNTDPTDGTQFLDSDNDGVPDFLDEDDDNDGILDVIEGDGDVDGDSIPNQLDLDSDGDGVSDQEEGIADANGDFIPNFIDVNTTGPQTGISDQDNDGLSDAIEGNGDADADGIANLLDIDSDNDSILDSVESNSDLDGDTIPNFLDTDSDGDGIPDAIEGDADGDEDQRGNFIDLDSDGDGIPDAIESTNDTDQDGIPDFLDTDSDGDGIPDQVETSADTDGDGIGNFLDDDSDGDGIPDSQEPDIDADGDGVPAILDPDDANPEVVAPIIETDGVVFTSTGCSIFDKSGSGSKDPLFLIAMLTALLPGHGRSYPAVKSCYSCLMLVSPAGVTTAIQSA